MQAPVRYALQAQLLWGVDHSPALPATPNWRRGEITGPSREEEWASAAFRRAYAHRIRTGSVYNPYPRTLYRVLVARTLTFSQHPCHYQEWAPGLAPHADLEAAYLSSRLRWDEFAGAYLQRLQTFPWLLAEARARMATLLTRYPLVVLLGLEPARDEVEVQCHRHVLRSWLLGEPCPVSSALTARKAS